MRGGIHKLRRGARASFPPPPASHRRCYVSSTVRPAESVNMQFENLERKGKSSGMLPGLSNMQCIEGLPLWLDRHDGQLQRGSPELEKTTLARLEKGSGSLEIAREELGKALGSLTCLHWRELWSQVHVKVCELCWRWRSFVGWAGSGSEEGGCCERRESRKRARYRGPKEW